MYDATRRSANISAVRVSSAIRRAVLVALASPACSSGTLPDAGNDATTPDALAGDVAVPDATDEDVGIDDSSVAFEAPYYPLPDGCTLSGKPDHFAPAGTRRR